MKDIKPAKNPKKVAATECSASSIGPTNKTMKTKTTKHPKQARAAKKLKDMKPKRDTKAGRDPAGNTYYVGSANGGVWKTT